MIPQSRLRRWPANRPVGDREQAGALLVELIIALTLLTVGLLGFLFATQANFNATRDISTRDRVWSAYSNAVETLNNSDFSTLYDTYDKTFLAPPTGITVTGKTTEAGELLGADGNPARVFVSFDVNETALPAEYGPVGDLDGDGALNTPDVSATYRLLPTRLTITYQTARGLETRQIFIVLGSRN